MNAKQRNKISMFRAVNEVFMAYPDELATIPVLTGYTQLFTDNLATIDEVYQIQQGNTKGVSKLKIKEENEMIEATVQMAGCIFVYAQDNGIPDLKDKCAISSTQLIRMPDEEVKTACLNIYAEAARLGGALTNYGKTPENIAQLKKEIDDFTSLIASPRSAIVTRSQATRELARLITENNDLLRLKVDKLMELFKTTNAKLYNTYKAARVIVDLRAGKQTIEEE
nr:hypothetical protein [uncultured Carboxylicivirga sp.]